MTQFGLTGGIASGKSTVAGMFADLGAKIIDADRVGHEMLLPSEPTHRQIVERFGQEILNAAGEIDRQRLGSMVFADPARLAELNAILHPAIIARVEERSRQLAAQSQRALVIVEAALIYEAGIERNFHKIMVAWCRPEQQIERLMRKTGISQEEAAQRIAAQMPVLEKRGRADYVIDCSGSKENTRQQVEQVYRELQRLIADNASTAH